MNWEAISAIGQLVGALAVVISLIYLARQVGSSARETRIALVRASADRFLRLLQQLTEHQDLNDLVSRGSRDFKSLERVEQRRLGSFYLQLLRVYEEAYYGKLHGQLDSRVWHDINMPMSDIMAAPGLQTWWRSRSHWFNEDFAKHIDQLQQNTKRFCIGGEVLQRIRYGQEKEDGGADRQTCECGANKGQLHFAGCVVERCPRCGGQAVYCDCPYDQRLDHPFAFLRLSLRSTSNR